MTEQYFPSSLDDDFDDRYGYDAFATPKLPDSIDITKKPTTPIEASKQSEWYVKELESIESSVETNIEHTQALKSAAKMFELDYAESSRKFVATVYDELSQIKQTEDPQIQRSLWEDVIDFSTDTRRAGYYGVVTPSYSGKNKLETLMETIYLGRVVGEVIRDAYGPLQGVSLKEWQLTEAMIKDIISNTHSSKDAQDVFSQNLGDRLAQYPDYANISPETRGKLSDIAQYMAELKHHKEADPISQGLSDFLTASVDDLLKLLAQEKTYAEEDVKKQSTYAHLDDETIARRARALVDEKQAPILEAARKHRQSNLALLKKAALAEAALDGVHIRRRSGPNPE